MKSSESLEEQLNQLGQELGRSPNLAQDVLDRVGAVTSNVASKRPRTSYRRLRLQVVSGLAASVLLGLGVWYFWQPKTLYARMLAALAETKTVHGTGWTRQVVRKWPLENPPEKDDGKDDKDVKYAMDVWYWTEPDGTPRCYERQGPVIATRRGGDQQEYQEDADLLYVSTGGFSKDRVGRFSQLARYLKALERPSLTKKDLGTHREDGRALRGLRYIEGNRIEDIWIDEQSNLPVRLIRSQKQSGERVLEIAFTINEQVPEQVVQYEPPKTDNVRYGGRHENVNLVWRQYVQEMGLRLQEEPIAGPIALLPRKDGRTFGNQWTLQTPDGKYWVMPLDINKNQQMDLPDFVHRHAATQEGERRHGTWRLPEESHDVEIPRSDLIYKDGTPWQEWVQFVLNRFDLEYVDKVEERTLWIAKHDGRALKPWQQVKPPVPYIVEGGVEQKGLVRPGIGHILHPVPLNDLFTDFNRMTDRYDMSADKPWIIDETGLPQAPPYDETEHGTYLEYWENVIEPQFLVATDSPWFVGEESLEMAKDWYRKEFGITFTEEGRPVTVHVIRRKP